MIHPIGELILQSGNPLLKMWNADVAFGSRPYVKHSHSRFEITVINSGSGEYTTENAVYPMLPGDVFVFSSNEIHCITSCGSEGLHITNLHFEPRYLNHENDSSPDDSFINFCFSHSPEFENRIPAAKAENIRFNHRMIKEELLNNKDSYPIAIKSYLNLILIDLLRNQHYRAQSPIDSRNCAFSMLLVYDYIEHHLCEEITLNALADLVHLSPNYFSHLFKQFNGISLWEYIIAKRIEKAMHLIRSRSDNLTMMEIALQCGFNNTVNFNKAFKKHKGITPSELRKNPNLLSN